MTDANVVLGYLPAVAGRRRDHPRRRGRPGRGRQDRRGDGPGQSGGGRGRHRRHRQREHARRAAAGLRAAGLRPAGLRAGRLRRRRPAARQRAGQADRRLAGDRAAVARGAVRAGRRDHEPARRVRPHRAAPVRRPHRRRAGRHPRRAGRRGRARLAEQGCTRTSRRTSYQVDVRYHGQGFEIAVDRRPRLAGRPGRRCGRLAAAFDAEHERLFSFLLGVDHELVNARATVTGPRPDVAPTALADGDGDPAAALVDTHADPRSGRVGARRGLRPGRSCGPAT